MIITIKYKDGKTVQVVWLEPTIDSAQLQSLVGESRASKLTELLAE